MLTKAYSILCLGDSYTIGEGVPLPESFPYQLVQGLREAGMDIYAPEITAKTGWTTDELLAAMGKINYRSRYDFVTLLIGVNNQYRGRSVEEYASQLEVLLGLALSLAGDQPKRVIVLSIPDWGVTPFAEGRDPAGIASAINQFNAVKQQMSTRLGMHFVDITPESREAQHRPDLLAADHLHPSALAYQQWAGKIQQYIIQQLTAP